MKLIDCKILFLASILVVQDHAKSEYITTVTPNCPPVLTHSGSARITVDTDLPDTTPVAYCKDNLDVDMELDLNGVYYIDAFFSGDSSSKCVFESKDGLDVFSIQIEIPETSSLMTSADTVRLVTCTYDPIGSKNSSESTFTDGLQPATEIKKHMATVSQSDVTLCAADIVGNCIKTSIRLGKTIKLKALLVGDFAGEVSFQALSCKAVSSKSSYSILIGGCGDGLVLPRDQGFTTTGKTAISPNFKSFRLPGSRSISFDCSFVVCDKECDGSSCATSSRRKKRSGEYTFERRITFSNDGAVDTSEVNTDVKAKVTRVYSRDRRTKQKTDTTRKASSKTKLSESNSETMLNPSILEKENGPERSSFRETVSGKFADIHKSIKETNDKIHIFVKLVKAYKTTIMSYLMVVIVIVVGTILIGFLAYYLLKTYRNSHLKRKGLRKY